MHDLVSGVRLLFSRKQSRRIFVIVFILFFLGILLLQNGKAAFELLSFDALSLSKRLALFFSTLFDLTSGFTLASLLLAVLGSLLGAANLALAYTYISLRGEVIVQSGLYSGFGLLAAILGIGCAACGTVLLSIVLGFFGASGALLLFPYGGIEIGFAGLFILLFATYALARKVAQPNVC
jgi:hypothetical protein